MGKLPGLYRHLCKQQLRSLHLRCLRNKCRAYLLYSKKRKRKKSRTGIPKRRLIHLLEKLIYQTDGLHRNHGNGITLSCDYQKRLSLIRKGLKQEKELFAGKKVSDRIVNIDRHYIHPIVRGKETKSVEFGAKVNNIQIDGISFIEHLSFKAFNIRLKDCILMSSCLQCMQICLYNHSMLSQRSFMSVGKRIWLS